MVGHVGAGGLLKVRDVRQEAGSHTDQGLQVYKPIQTLWTCPDFVLCPVQGYYSPAVHYCTISLHIFKLQEKFFVVHAIRKGDVYIILEIERCDVKGGLGRAVNHGGGGGVPPRLARGGTSQGRCS